MLLLLFIYGGIHAGPPPARGGHHPVDGPRAPRRNLVFRRPDDEVIRPDDEDALVMTEII